MGKITFEDKVDITVKPIPEVNKIVAANVNEIKEKVNENDDNVGPLSSLLTTIKTSIVNAINELYTAVSLNTSKVSADGSVTTHSDVFNAGRGNIITTAEGEKVSRIDSMYEATVTGVDTLPISNKNTMLYDGVVFTIQDGKPSDFVTNVDVYSPLGTESATLRFDPAIVGENGLANMPDILIEAGDFINVSIIPSNGRMKIRGN